MTEEAMNRRTWPALLEAAASARKLADRCEQEAAAYPREANHLRSEAARHKERAAWWLQWAKREPSPRLPA